MFLAVYVCLVFCAYQSLAFKIALPMKSRFAMSRVAMAKAPAAASTEPKVKKEVVATSARILCCASSLLINLSY